MHAYFFILSSFLKIEKSFEVDVLSCMVLSTFENCGAAPRFLVAPTKGRTECCLDFIFTSAMTLQFLTAGLKRQSSVTGLRKAKRDGVPAGLCLSWILGVTVSLRR